MRTVRSAELSSPPPSPDSPLIECAQLAARCGRHDLKIFDCRFELSRPDWGRAAFGEGHLPGAQYAHLDHDLSGPLVATSGRHPLPSPEAFSMLLRRWNLRPDDAVVCYDQGPGAYAARLWWMLTAFGHLRVQVLNGGWARWNALNLPIETRSPSSAPAIAAPALRSAPEFSGVLTTEQVQYALEQHQLLLVDARSADRFAGQNETLDPVAGHVPGAANQPFAQNLGADGRYLDAPALTARWQTVLATRGGRDLAMMCGSGVTACHNLLALRVLGIRDAKLYAGSYSEWIRDPARPVATGVS